MVSVFFTKLESIHFVSRKHNKMTMLKIGIASMFILCSVHLIAQISITEVAELPVRISNNAVSEGFIEGKPYLYSFGGIDSSKKYSGIHLKSYRFNIDNNTTIQIPNLPDTLGKIAAAASRIGNTIYIWRISCFSKQHGNLIK